MSEDAPGPGIKLADLRPGMELEGQVTRTELYGAFVDVGAEREGLVHISMLQPGKVNRVEDVVNPGDAVQVWVQRVEPEKGRLELTMVKPVSLKWEDVRPGMKAKGQVVRLEKFGAFVDIGADRPGLVHISEMSSDYVSKPGDVVQVGEEVDVVVLDVDRKKRQIRLSMKVIPDDLDEDETEVVEERLPTAMEVALRKALDGDEAEGSGEPGAADANKPTRKSRKDQEDILTRTLKQRLRTSSNDD